MPASAAAYINKHVLLQGGYQEESGILPKHPRASKNLIVISVESYDYKVSTPQVTDFKMATVGHTALEVDDTCVLFIGACNESVFAYTSNPSYHPHVT